MKDKNIAILFREVDSFGGAVTTAAKQAKYFDADFYCISYNEDVFPSIFEDVNVETYGNKIKSPLLENTLDRLNLIYNTDVEFLSDYDIIIAQSHTTHILAYKAKKKFKNTKAFWYCHHPIKGLYDIHSDLYGSESRQFQLLSSISKKLTINKDQNSYHGLDKVFVNSKYTLEDQVKKAYTLNQNTEVLYPPIKIQTKAKKSGDYALVVSRVVRFKQLERAITTLSNLDKNIPLKIVGNISDIQYKQELEKLAEKNSVKVEFLGFVDDDTLEELICNCGFGIFTSEREDFGLVPLEFFSSGKVCFVPDSAGVAEFIPENYQYSDTKNLAKNIGGMDNFLDYSHREKIKNLNEKHFSRIENAMEE